MQGIGAGAGSKKPAAPGSRAILFGEAGALPGVGAVEISGAGAGATPGAA
jgi:hypothetical protein